MTPAFDATIAECTRLHVRWWWELDVCTGAPWIYLENINAVGPDDPEDEAISRVRVSLSERCIATRFRVRAP